MPARRPVSRSAEGGPRRDKEAMGVFALPRFRFTNPGFVEKEPSGGHSPQALQGIVLPRWDLLCAAMYQENEAQEQALRAKYHTGEATEPAPVSTRPQGRSGAAGAQPHARGGAPEAAEQQAQPAPRRPAAGGPRPQQPQPASPEAPGAGASPTVSSAPRGAARAGPRAPGVSPPRQQQGQQQSASGKHREDRPQQQPQQQPPATQPGPSQKPPTPPPAPTAPPAPAAAPAPPRQAQPRPPQASPPRTARPAPSRPAPEPPAASPRTRQRSPPRPPVQRSPTAPRQQAQPPDGAVPRGVDRLYYADIKHRQEQMRQLAAEHAPQRDWHKLPQSELHSTVQRLSERPAGPPELPPLEVTVGAKRMAPGEREAVARRLHATNAYDERQKKLESKYEAKWATTAPSHHKLTTEEEQASVTRLYPVPQRHPG
eukprot:TRINITY_DN55489_c0_g1_i1.p1 TRINITY_DN55489_c0_g1~~TRINITY_DN55489_c0_g1_i1.p1  ORF type:complete len:428 (+),score=87.37 TRINITY_DN55489_c0_g1_i1:74-1357(+)